MGTVTNNERNGPPATEIINHFDLPSELKNITGQFKYRFFEPTEQVDEENAFGQGEDNSDPRYIKLTWEGEQDEKIYCFNRSYWCSYGKHFCW